MIYNVYNDIYNDAMTVISIEGSIYLEYSLVYLHNIYCPQKFCTYLGLARYTIAFTN